MNGTVAVAFINNDDTPPRNLPTNGPSFLFCYWVGQKKVLKIKTEILRKFFFQFFFFLHGEKENFEEYSLILEYAELSFPILNNYLAEKRQPCPRATV
jgi:hypothetical protein